MDFNSANRQLLRWYRKCYHSLNDTMILDMRKPQVKNKMYELLKPSLLFYFSFSLPLRMSLLVVIGTWTLLAIKLLWFAQRLEYSIDEVIHKYITNMVSFFS